MRLVGLPYTFSAGGIFLVTLPGKWTCTEHQWALASMFTLSLLIVCASGVQYPPPKKKGQLNSLSFILKWTNGHNKNEFLQNRILLVVDISKILLVNWSI